jgi:L-glyceraldehyde 3-phosphate reductase
MINRWIEDDGLLDVLDEQGMGCIPFVPLAQGLLTDKYLNGIPEGSRAAQGKSLDPTVITDEVVRRLRGLNDIAASRGQSLAQLALSWVLRDTRVTSALIGASSVRQLEANVAAVGAPALTADELAAIDGFAVESGVNLWSTSSDS